MIRFILCTDSSHGEDSERSFCESNYLAQSSLRMAAEAKVCNISLMLTAVLLNNLLLISSLFFRSS